MEGSPNGSFSPLDNSLLDTSGQLSDKYSSRDESSIVREILTSGNKPEDWRDFFQYIRCQADFESDEDRNTVLSLIYTKATQNIDDNIAKRNAAYAELLVSYACIQRERQGDAARGYFKEARDRARYCAAAHVAWAEFEMEQGRWDDARVILAQAVKSHVEPKHLIESAAEKLEAHWREVEHLDQQPASWKIEVDLKKIRRLSEIGFLPSRGGNAPEPADEESSSTATVTSSKKPEEEMARPRVPPNRLRPLRPSNSFSEASAPPESPAPMDSSVDSGVIDRLPYNDTFRTLKTPTDRPWQQQQQQQQQQHRAIRPWSSATKLSRIEEEHGNAARSRRPLQVLSHENFPPKMEPPDAPPRTSLETLRVNSHEYLVLRLLGKGGFSQVFEGFDTTNKRTVAVKRVLVEDESHLHEYRGEIELLLQLQDSDRVVRLVEYELDMARSRLLLVMERGETDLASLFRRENPLSSLRRRSLWEQMLLAVRVIHEKNIIHRDLKPANFLLVEGRLKLIDFGISSRLQRDRTSITCVQGAGTLNFMSPETLCALDEDKLKIGRKSDIWSLGCILYLMAFGKTPFEHITTPLSRMFAICNEQTAISFPACDEPLLLDTLQRCLTRDPRQRCSIEQLLEHPYVRPPVSNDGVAHVLQRLQESNVLTPRSLDRVTKIIFHP